MGKAAHEIGAEQVWPKRSLAKLSKATGKI
jgi:hypothetical protein